MEWIYEILESLFGIGETEVVFDPKTGWPSNVLPDIKRKITRIINDEGYDEIYIGRSSYPTRRINKHRTDKGNFKKALIVYKTQSQEHAQEVERSLIKHYLKADNVEVLNQSEDSRGNIGEPPYYVYVVLR